MDANEEYFIHMHFGYCFYELEPKPFIYGLYINETYRRKGYAKKILKMVIDEIRGLGITDVISIEAEPQDDSIPLDVLRNLYKSLGLEVL